MQVGVTIDGVSKEATFNPTFTSASVLSETICRNNGLDLQSEACTSSLTAWVQGALDRRDYERRARTVALDLAAQVGYAFLPNVGMTVQ